MLCNGLRLIVIVTNLAIATFEPRNVHLSVHIILSSD